MPTENTEQIATISPDAILDCILDMGELLLTSGAEVLRVEDTLTRLCDAYGFTKINVFSLTSCIMLTVHSSSGRIITQTRRVSGRNTDLQKIALVNALSRELCQTPISVEQFQSKLSDIQRTKTYSLFAQCFSYALISAAFSVFFGGSAWDGVAAAISGVFVFGIQHLMQKLRMNSILRSLLVSACTAFVVVLLVHFGIGQVPEKITIGNIMLLIPGISFTTSLRDIVNGDTISGLVGISEAIIKAIAIAIGFAAVLVEFGGLL